jgi:hypothetical protein
MSINHLSYSLLHELVENDIQGIEPYTYSFYPA